MVFRNQSTTKHYFMKHFHRLVLVLLMLCLGHTAHAQFLKRLKEKATNAATRTIERKVENKAAETTDKAIDSLFTGEKGTKRETETVNEIESESTESETMDDMQTFPTDTETVPISNELYEFHIEVDMEMTTTEGELFPITYLLNENSNYFGMKADLDAYSGGDVQGSSVIVMDGENVRVFVDSPMMKMQMNQSMGNQQGNQIPKMDDFDFTQPTKTGNTKTILGYICDEYTLEADGNQITFWCAPEVSLPNWTFGSAEVMEQTGVLGFVMEFSATQKEGTTTGVVTNINQDASLTINPKEYKKMF